MSAEVRDKVAELEGWTQQDEIGGEWMHASHEWQYDHPIPDTLDACAAAWDRHAGGLVLCMTTDYVVARTQDDDYVADVPRSGHDAAAELRDRWALLGEVLKARGVA